MQLALLPAGFYAGFLLAAGMVVRFTRGVMDREMALERRVPWFVGAVLVITYLEVFTWVHGSLRILPRPAVYAPLVILAGGLVLHVDGGSCSRASPSQSESSGSPSCWPGS